MADGDLHEPLRCDPRRPMAVKRRLWDGPENHGVPGSNPGPATLESPANRGKSKSSGSACEALRQRRVNSRIEKRPISLTADEESLCCLFEDGNLITSPTIRIDLLLEAEASPGLAVLLIRVRTRPTLGAYLNLRLM